jgi:uncharacterized protein YqeY
MSLHQTIKDQIKEAMKSKDSVRLGVLRGLLSGFTNELVATKRTPQEELSDEEVLNVIRRGVKQRKDSIEQFTKGQREDLADSERSELKVLEEFLPQMMSSEEITQFVKTKMAELSITDKSKSGQLMGVIMKDLKGKADGDMVKSALEKLLS